MSKVSDQIRKEWKESDAKRDAGLKTPDDIMRFDDIVYGKSKKWQILDVYRPKKAKKKKLPVIVSIHGGGWVYGDKNLYQYYCMSLAQKGFAVVNFTYRLAPEYKFPAPLEDTNLVMKWILKNADEYGLDTKHIFGVGDSAGGQILGLYACIATNKKYAEKYDFKVPKGFAFTAIALNCGDYDPSKDGGELTCELMADYLENKGSKKEMKMIAVTKHVTSKFPPAFVMTSTGDFLKNQAPLIANKLMKYNVPFELHLYGTSENMLPHVFHCDMYSKDGAKCNQDECDYFKSFI